MVKHPKRALILHTEIPMWMLRLALVLAIALVVGSWVLALR